MRHLHVGAARHFQFSKEYLLILFHRISRILIPSFMLFCAFNTTADTPFVSAETLVPDTTFVSPAPLSQGPYLARVLLNSPADVQSALMRAKALLDKGLVGVSDPPVSFVLHGPEVAIFLRENYDQYRDIVDLAAQLSAFKVIDVKVCRTRLANIGGSEQQLVPFVGTVPFGPVEVKRLLEDEDYIYF